jgi:hypothetical protein
MGQYACSWADGCPAYTDPGNQGLCATPLGGPGSNTCGHPYADHLVVP